MARTTIAEEIAGHGIVVTHDGAIYVSEPGAHSDKPSRVWRIRSGEKRLLDGTISGTPHEATHPAGLPSVFPESLSPQKFSCNLFPPRRTNLAGGEHGEATSFHSRRSKTRTAA